MHSHTMYHNCSFEYGSTSGQALLRDSADNIYKPFTHINFIQKVLSATRHIFFGRYVHFLVLAHHMYDYKHVRRLLIQCMGSDRIGTVARRTFSSKKKFFKVQNRFGFCVFLRCIWLFIPHVLSLY